MVIEIRIATAEVGHIDWIGAPGNFLKIWKSLNIDMGSSVYSCQNSLTYTLKC